MSASRLVTSILASTLFLCGAVRSLPTDQDIGRMLSSAEQLDIAGNGAARDAIFQEVRSAVRARAAADSSVATAMEFLDRLDVVIETQEKQKNTLLRDLQALVTKGDSVAAKKRYEVLAKRFPNASLPSLRSLLARYSPSTAATPEPDSCASTPAGCSSPAVDTSKRTTARMPASACPSGPPRASFLQPSSSPVVVKATDSALLLTMSIDAPCLIGRVELRRDSQLVRSFQAPLGKTGIFELDDAILVPPGTRTVSLVVCDTFGACQQAAVKLQSAHSIPPWIPWASGGIVMLGLVTGFVALFRRPAPPPKPGARGVLIRSTIARPSTPIGTPVDITPMLRQIISQAEKSMERGPRLVSRLNAIPAVDGNQAELERALGALLQLPVARAGLRGTVLVATGRGPVSMEVVLEDNGPDLDDATLRSLFDPATQKLRERQGADTELLAAADIVMRHHGHLAAEPRIDGGLRLRIRLPLPSANGPRTASLLK